MGTTGTTVGDMVLRKLRSVSFHAALGFVRFFDTVTRIPEIVKSYHRSLTLHIELVDKLRSHSTTFEDSREIVNKWAEQPWLEGTGWEAAWEDICEAEVERWGGS